LGTARLSSSIDQAQVEHSPHVDTDKPVSRQKEEELAHYYGWTPYWGMLDPLLGAGGAIAWAPMNVQTAQGLDEPRGDLHLGSAREVMGYRVQAVEGLAGRIDDFIVSSESWDIRYIVADTGGWLPGKKVQFAPQWVSKVSWAERKFMSLSLKKRSRTAPSSIPSLWRIRNRLRGFIML
jgi:hypothetical protein